MLFSFFSIFFIPVPQKIIEIGAFLFFIEMFFSLPKHDCVFSFCSLSFGTLEYEIVVVVVVFFFFIFCLTE